MSRFRYVSHFCFTILGFFVGISNAIAALTVEGDWFHTVIGPICLAVGAINLRFLDVYDKHRCCSTGSSASEEQG